MKKIVSLLVICVIFLAGCGETKDPLADGYLDVGMDCAYAPYSYTVAEKDKTDSSVSAENSKSYCDGYDVIIASKVAEELGVEVKIHRMSFDGLIPALSSGQIDVVMAGINPSDERAKVIDFSDTYYSDDTQFNVVVKSDSKYASAKNLEDLDGAAISAQLGTTHVDLIKQIPNVKETTAQAQYVTLIEQTKKGTIDGYIVENPVGEAQVSGNGELKLLNLKNNDTGFEVTPELTDIVAGISKENTELKTKFNDALSTITNKQRIEYMSEAQKNSGE